MKKIIFTAATAILSSVAMAQSGYVSLNLGYGLASPGEKLGTDTELVPTGVPAPPLKKNSESNIYGTLGPGLNIGLTPGIMLTEHFGLEIGLNYFMGSEVDVNRVKSPLGEYNITAQSTQFRLLPAIVLSTGTDKKINGYMKAGLVIPATGVTTTKLEDTGYAGPGTASTTEYETKGAFSLGFSGTLGANVKMTDKFSIFGELSGNHLRINAKERTMTASSANGTENLGTKTTYQKEVVYKDELTSSSNNAGYNANFSQGSAQEELRTRNNFGAIFINIGVKYNF